MKKRCIPIFFTCLIHHCCTTSDLRTCFPTRSSIHAQRTRKEGLFEPPRLIISCTFSPFLISACFPLSTFHVPCFFLVMVCACLDGADADQARHHHYLPTSSPFLSPHHFNFNAAATMTTEEPDGSLTHHVFQFCIPCIKTSPQSTCFYNSTPNSNPNSASSSCSKPHTTHRYSFKDGASRNLVGCHTSIRQLRCFHLAYRVTSSFLC